MIELNQDLLSVIKKISEEAGQAILDIYQKNDFEFQIKSDQSPLTQADLASHHIIIKALKKLTPEIPILSEEGEKLEGDIDTFWCVDPLDGTKEFIKRNGEFTVNIALIKNYKSVLGVIHIPVIGQTFMAIEGGGSFSIINNHKEKLPINNDFFENPVKFAISRSHQDDETIKFIKKHKAVTIKAGSSLKLIYVAQGKAHAYPRFGPTSLWDIAAGHIIINEVGGEIIDFNEDSLRYNPKRILNPSFLAIKHSSLKFI